MPRITALEPQQNDPERVNVFLDGAFAFGASRLVAMAHGLVTERELSDEEIEALVRDDSAERAYGAALHFLSYRPRSRREIENYFRKRKVDEELVPGIMEKLERIGLVDDRAFAAYWIENRQAFRPRGSRALRQEMRQKGLAGEVIEDALEALPDEEAAAYEAGAKKARALSALDEREFFRKMVGFLQRRGFSYDIAAAVARRLYQEQSAPSDQS